MKKIKIKLEVKVINKEKTASWKITTLDYSSLYILAKITITVYRIEYKGSKGWYSIIIEVIKRNKNAVLMLLCRSYSNANDGIVIKANAKCRIVRGKKKNGKQPNHQ